MTYISPNTVSTEIWRLAKGNKKEYGRLMRLRNRESTKIQSKERLNNLKRMLAKGLISKEEYEQKLSTT